MLLIVFTMIFLTSLAFGQIVTTIADVQDTTGGAGGGESHLMGKEVTVEGTVSAESWAFGNGWYFIQSGTGPWSGIYVWDENRGNSYGDSVRVTGSVDEYYDLTYIWLSDYVKLDSGKTVEPTVVTTGEIGTNGSNAEAFESVLVRVKDVEITKPDLDFGEWEVNDGSGPCRVDDDAAYYFSPADYDSVRSITGILNYSFSDTKIEPRLAYDVVEAGEFTRIQRVQQVRMSSLLKTPDGSGSDGSLLAGDTVKVTGIVTLPTGLSDPGYGIEFQIQDPNGGPWSSIVSWAEDTTQYPNLFVGDVVIYEGYVWEWQAGSSSETEIMVTSPNIAIIDYDKLTPIDTISTGDLRLPSTAEQWENCKVIVKDAVVTELDPTNYELFGIDDGSGQALVGAVSTAIPDPAEFNDPPLGAIYATIQGYASNRYGSFDDSTNYKLEPMYYSDMVLGSGPPMMLNISRNPGLPNATDPVQISLDVTSNLNVKSVEINYSVDGAAYQTADMTAGTEDKYEGSIPAQSDGSFVEYYIKATDTAEQSSVFPGDTSAFKYGYVARDGDLTIADIQYSPWVVANSPYDGHYVEVTGIVTADTAANNNHGAYSIQDDKDLWSGLFLFGVNGELERGDHVTVSGTLTEHNPDWDYKWGYNTVLLVDTVKVNSSGHKMSPLYVESDVLSNDTTSAESYEGVLVQISQATLISINEYDATFDDGSGPCLVDDDFTSPEFQINSTDGYIYAFGDTVRPGEVIENIRGVYLYSFGSYKIEVRDVEDWGTAVGVNSDFNQIPLSYQLKQNYPNPFNPETHIYFEIPQMHDVKLEIYNILGQKVRSLINGAYNPGRHTVTWNGRNDSGMIVPSGVYIYRLHAGSFMVSKKMLMLK